MNRSLVLITAAAALGLAACTSAPAAENATSTPSSTTTPPSVTTEVVTQTVTDPPAPPAKPVIGSFGYGPLKLGMTLQQALDTKLIGPARPGGRPSDNCTIHDLLGTGRAVSVSKRVGVANIQFNADMTSDGVGVGATEAALKAKYTNLYQRHMSTSWSTQLPDNPNASIEFTGNDNGVLIHAQLMHDDQDCHS